MIKFFVACSAALVLLLSGCSDNSEAPKQSAAVTPTAQQTQEIKVTNWGPRGTVAGKGFAVQPNGDSALWFEFSGPGNANNLEVWFGDQKLSGVAINPGKAGSAQITKEQLATPKTVPVYLVHTLSGKKIDLGIFEISSAQ